MHIRKLFLQIIYTVVAQGLECSIYREIHEGPFHIKSTVIEIPTLVLRYQGDSPLSIPEAAIVVSDMEKAVTKAITIMSNKIQGHAN